MPFIKKNHSSSTQTSSAFIGRTVEMLFFVHDILQPETPTHNILSISGQGGVGKSTLLARFIDKARSNDYKEYCLTAMVDERQTTPIGIMQKLAQQLHITGKFEKALNQYKEALQNQQTEQETPREALFKGIPDAAGALVEGIPIAGPLLREGTKVAATYFLQEYQVSQSQKDRELLETAVDEVTRAFVAELNDLANAKVMLSATRKKRQRRIILFFDTFEQLGTEATPWLLDHFLETQLSSNIVLVVAGRNPIEHTLPDATKRWLPYWDDGTLCWISLNSFTEDETRLYLVQKGITDADQIANIWHQSQGLPLYLGLLTSNYHGDIDLTKDVVDNFLRWIPEKEQIKRQLALDAALFSKPFNQDDLEAFSYVPEADRSSLYQWLTEQPFVRSQFQDGRYLYHDVARDLFSRHLYQRSQKDYYETRRALAAYYQKILEKMQVEQGKEMYRLEEWLELLLAIVFQLFLLPDQASQVKAIEFILDAYHGNTNKEQDREIARALRDLSQEPSAYPMSPTARKTAIQLLRYIDADRTREWLESSSALLETVAHASFFPSTVLASMYYARGRAYNASGSEFFNKELAIEDFGRALELFEATNYYDRGFAYFYSRNYRKALVVHNQALEQNPQDVDAYFGRGWAYYNLEEYQRAVDDFEHVLKLAPNYDNPGGLYNGLRWAYYQTGKYQQALSANDHYLKLHPEDYRIYVFQCRCYLVLKEYQQAIDACNRALELAPKAEVYVEIGWAYFYAKNYQEALTYHNQALEQNPQDIDAYLGRGWAHHRLGKPQRAIDDFEHVRKLAPNYHNPGGLYNGLRWAYYQTGKYQQALSANDHYLKLHPEDYQPYIFRCRCYLSLKEYQQAIDACNHALELAPKKAEAYFQRGLISLWLKGLEQAQADFIKSCELEPTNIDYFLMATWAEMCREAVKTDILEQLGTISTIDPQCYSAHVCQGIVLLLGRHFREAFAELEQAFLSKTDSKWEVHFWKGMTYAFLEQDEEAIAAIEKALDLKLPPMLLAPLRRFEQERPAFYEKHVIPLLTKHT